MVCASESIGNHTWDHKALTKMTTAQMVAEFAKTQAVISAVTKDQAPYMRPPGGASNAHVHQVAASKSYRVVMWNRTFGDSGRGATPEKLYQNAWSVEVASSRETSCFATGAQRCRMRR